MIHSAALAWRWFASDLTECVRPAFLVAAGVAMSLGSTVHAQCAPGWVAGFGVPGIGGTLTNQLVARTIMWDPDGAGPQPPVLVVAGRFTNAGGVAANNIATWNPSTGAWSALGTGMNGYSVRALAILPNGQLVAGGTFTTAGGAAANNIARWNGSTWTALGTGTSDTVTALAVLPNGDLVAGGYFFRAGGVTTNFIAKWNGSMWSGLGSGFDSIVGGLLVLPGGDLIAVGDFTATGSGQPVQHVARWSGTAWSALGAGVGNASDFAISVVMSPNGDLVVGGLFAAPANGVAKWNGTAWSALGTGLSESAVESLLVLPSGDLIAAGHIATAGSASVNNIARWDGSTWSALGAGINGTGYPLAYDLGLLPGGDVVVGGLFTTAGDVTANNIARYSPGQMCRADFNCSGGPAPLSVQDIFDFLAAWFAQDPRADFNGVNAITPQDIFDFLNAWFAGC